MSHPRNPKQYSKPALRSSGPPPPIEEAEEDSESEVSTCLSAESSTLYSATSSFGGSDFLIMARIEMPKFSGAPGSRAADWLHKYENYCELINYNEEKKLKGIAFYLEAEADAFYRNLKLEVRNDYKSLSDLLTARFSGNDGATEIWDITQSPEETSSRYITRVLNAAQNMQYPEEMLASITIRGLRSEIRNIVMPQGLNDLEKIRKAAQLAERTLATAPTAHVAAAFSDIVSEQIAGLSEKNCSDESC
jgi:hypothetical protein